MDLFHAYKCHGRHQCDGSALFSEATHRLQVLIFAALWIASLSILAGCQSDEPTATTLQPEDFAQPESAGDDSNATHRVVDVEKPQYIETAASSKYWRAEKQQASGLFNNTNSQAETETASNPNDDLIQPTATDTNNTTDTTPFNFDSPMAFSATAGEFPSESSNSNDPNAEAAPAERFVLDGMVGQVNGQPIFARQIFQDNHEQLVQNGRRLPADEFRESTAGLIRAQLQGIISDALLFGEAERALEERERFGLLGILNQYREETIRRFGQGSAAVADAYLQGRDGITLEQYIEDFRKEWITRRHINKVINPRIVVTRLDIQRYWRENQDIFNPDPQTSIRIMWLESEADATNVISQLAGGQDFAEIAGTEINQFRRSERGFFGEVDPESFRFEEIVEAVQSLSEGEWTSPIEINDRWWIVFVESKPEPIRVALREVQQQIEDTLRGEQFRQYSTEYRRELLETGSFTDLNEMGQALLTIAMSRYAGVSVTQNEDEREANPENRNGE